MTIASENPTDKMQDMPVSYTHLDVYKRQAEVRTQEQFYQQQGIHSVPAVIINARHLISGGQAPDVFEQALREIAAMA